MADHRALPGVITLVLALMVLIIVAAPAVSAQDGAPCAVETVPDDDLASAAVGLTRQEMDALYSPGNSVQTGWLYEFAGFDLTLSNRDLILAIDPGGEFADFEAARDLAARYRLLGEPRTGSVLVLYTYDGNAYDPGSVIRVEIHPAVIPG